MKVVKVVCDVCESEETTQYELRSQGKNVKVDLCVRDAEPLERFLGPAKPRGRAAAKKAPAKKSTAKKSTPRAGRKPRNRVSSMEEIEALKQQG